MAIFKSKFCTSSFFPILFFNFLVCKLANNAYLLIHKIVFYKFQVCNQFVLYMD